MAINDTWPEGTASLILRFEEGRAIGREGVDWAVAALLHGYDSESLRVLAGLDLGEIPSAFEANDLFSSALEELGIEVPRTEELRYLFVIETAKAIVQGALDPKKGATLVILRAVSPLDYPEDLLPWYNVWEGLCADGSRSLTNREINSEILQLAQDWVRESA